LLYHPRMLKTTTAPATRKRLGLAAAEYALLMRLRTPLDIQAFLDSIPANHELNGETIQSVRQVLRKRCAHCIEGAFVASCALWINGEVPLVMHLDCEDTDYPHVVTLFRRRGAWGAISKTNGPGLRFRDPVYRTLRELAMSYFHEYSDRLGRRTLRSHSVAFDLRKLSPSLWVTPDGPCEVAQDRIVELRHYPLIATAQKRLVSRLSPFERKVAKILQYPKPAGAR